MLELWELIEVEQIRLQAQVQEPPGQEFLRLFLVASRWRVHTGDTQQIAGEGDNLLLMDVYRVQDGLGDG